MTVAMPPKVVARPLEVAYSTYPTEPETLLKMILMNIACRSSQEVEQVPDIASAKPAITTPAASESATPHKFTGRSEPISP